MSSDVRDFSRRLTARLDAVIAQNTAQLIKVGADQHDKVAGLIQGYMHARVEVEREMKDWLVASDREDAA